MLNTHVQSKTRMVFDKHEVLIAAMSEKLGVNREDIELFFTDLARAAGEALSANLVSEMKRYNPGLR